MYKISLTSKGCKTTKEKLWRTYQTLRTSDMYVFKRKEFLGHSGSGITGTYASKYRQDRLSVNFFVLKRFSQRSENGVAIERTRTAIVLSLVICVNREQRPYVQAFFIIIIIKTLQISESTGRYEIIVRYACTDDVECTVQMDY